MDQERESSQAERLPRGAKRRARTRADLFMAARKVFVARGYHDATITEITETADVGVGTFYLHFQDKETLFTTLIEEGLDAIRRLVMADLAHDSNPSLPMVVRAIFQRVYEQRDIFRIARMGEQVAHRSPGSALLVELFTSFLESTPDLAPFSEDEIPLLALLLEGIMDRAFHWWGEQDEPAPSLMAEHVLFVMKHGFPAALFEGSRRPGFTLSDKEE